MTYFAVTPHPQIAHTYIVAIATTSAADAPAFDADVRAMADTFAALP